MVGDGGTVRFDYAAKMQALCNDRGSVRGGCLIQIKAIASAVNRMDKFDRWPFIGQFLAQFFDMAVDSAIADDAVIVVHARHQLFA